MNHLFPLLILFGLSLFSCQQAVDPILPLVEVEIEEKTCHLTAKAVVQYREGHHGSAPFYYLAILDDQGKQVAEVYTGSIQDGALEVGEEISIRYHYEIGNGFSYVSACGNEAENQPSLEEMARIVVCTEKTNS